MSFILPELVVESVIRDGVAGLVNNLEVVDIIFASLKEPYNARKYGQKEINRIKALFEKKEINVVHNLNDVNSTVPCFSIQLGSDVEKQGESFLEDLSDQITEEITDAEELAALIKAANIVPVSYNSKSGVISLSPGEDLSTVQKGNVFVDALGVEHDIKVVVRSVPNPQIFVEKGSDVDITDFCEIQSSLNFRQYEEKTIVGEEQLIVGCHSKDALTTKYMYILLKYFLNSRKKSLNERCFIVSTFQGSDFARAGQYGGDHVYHRFYTIKGRIDDSWKANQIDLIENVEVQVLVPKDEALASDLGKEDATVKPSDREDFKC